MNYNHKKIYFSIIVMIFLVFLTGCSKNTTNNVTGDVVLKENLNSIEKIEVYHFHSNKQCNVCKTIGANLDETINRYFLDEVVSGKMVYGHINVQLPENEEITKRYGAQGTSLWIGVYDENGFHAENDMQIWYKLQDKEEFISYLKNTIDKRLAGDMN